jgi:hypothetical protein
MELGALIIPLLLDAKNFTKGVEDAKTKSKELHISLKDIGNFAAGAAAGGIAALTGAMAGAVAKTVEWRNRTDDLGKALGTSVEESSGLSLLADRVGMSAEDVSGAMQKLVKGLGDSQSALGSTGTALQNLGISAFDATGDIRPATDILQDVSNVLGNMPDSLTKTSLEMSLFGKSGAEMNEILGTAANGGIKDFVDQAQKMGLVISPEKSAQIEQFQRESKKFDETLQGLAVSIGVKLIPKLIPLLEKLTDLAVTVLPPLVDFIANNLVPILIVLGAIIMANVVPSIIAIGTSAMAAAPGIIAALSPVILPILAIVAAVAAVIVIIKLLSDHWGEVWGFISNVANTVGTFVSHVFEGWVFIFDSIGKAIQGVVDWFKNLGNSISQIQLPKWLTPGSPTPLENGLVGIKNAMRDVSGLASTEFSASLKLGNSPINSITKNDNSDLISAFRNSTSTATMDTRSMDLLASRIANQLAIAQG